LGDLSRIFDAPFIRPPFCFRYFSLTNFLSFLHQRQSLSLPLP